MKEKRGRFKFYDKQQVLKDIVSGDLSAKSIAEKHDITRDMVYTLKYNARKKNIIRDPVQKLDDLDTVERPEYGKTIGRIYSLAQDFKEDKIAGGEFIKQVSLLWK